MPGNPHDFIHFKYYYKENVFAIVAPLYEKGLSLREIENRTGYSKTKIRSVLIKGKVRLRPSSVEMESAKWGDRGKKGVKPPYGYCYLEGEIIRDPRKYPVLLDIIQRWKLGEPMNSIATWLNGRGIPSPMNKKWSWNSVKNIIDRFEKEIRD